MELADEVTWLKQQLTEHPEVCIKEEPAGPKLLFPAEIRSNHNNPIKQA